MTDKEKIIAYIDKLLEKYPKNYYLLMVAEFIDNLEEKEVDLKKEMSEYFVEHSDEFFSDKYKLFAKYFFELGIKAAQKGK